MKIINNLLNKKFIIVLVVIVAVLIVLNLVVKGRPQVVKVKPETPSNLSLNPVFTITLDQQPTNIQIKTSPQFSFNKKIEEKSIKLLTTEKLEPESTYKITINYKNQPIYIYTFTTRPLQETEIIEREQQEVLEEHPLINFLPLENQYYQLTYSGPMQLTVFLKQSTREEALEKIKEWLRNKGVDPDTHEIIVKKQ